MRARFLLSIALSPAASLALAQPQSVIWKSYSGPPRDAETPESTPLAEFTWTPTGGDPVPVPWGFFAEDQPKYVDVLADTVLSLPDRDGDGCREIAIPYIPTEWMGAGGVEIRSGRVGSPLGGPGPLSWGGEFGAAAGLLPAIGDRIPERLVVGAPQHMGVNAYGGSQVVIYDAVSDRILHSIEGDPDYPDGFARTLVTDADVDLDGVPDIAIGRCMVGPGSIMIYSGLDYGLLRSIDCPLEGDWGFPSNHERAMVSVGDVDGRGSPDFAVHGSRVDRKLMPSFGPESVLVVVAGEDGELLARRRLPDFSRSRSYGKALSAIHDPSLSCGCELLSLEPWDANGESVDRMHLVTLDPRDLSIRSARAPGEFGENSTRIIDLLPWADHDGDGVEDYWVKVWEESLAYYLVSGRSGARLGMLRPPVDGLCFRGVLRTVPDVDGDLFGELVVEASLERGSPTGYLMLKGASLTLTPDSKGGPLGPPK